MGLYTPQRADDVDIGDVVTMFVEGFELALVFLITAYDSDGTLVRIVSHWSVLWHVLLLSN